jgi:hypothetical protein
MAHEVAPTATTMALLVNPTDPNTRTLSNELATAAQTLGLKLHIVHARNEGEIEQAFASVAPLRVRALVIGTDVYFNSRSEQLGALTLRYAMPTIYQYREFSMAGGLISYGGILLNRTVWPATMPGASSRVRNPQTCRSSRSPRSNSSSTSRRLERSASKFRRLYSCAPTR